MKFDCDRFDRWLERRERRISEWHPWFAWRPVRVADGDCRWLETVERKGSLVCADGDCWRFWEYRLP